MAKTRKHRTPVGNSPIEATYHGLQEWYTAKFEKLGWMILAKERGMMDKVLSYQNSIHRLHSALDHKIKHMRDKDKKADLIIMKKNVEILLEHVKADFA